ncbi:hypothetical protein Tco_0214799 [Tanacetum coccineum]
MNENGNLFVPASMGYDHEMVPKSKDWVERLNPDSKLPNFNTGRILVPEIQAINKSLKPTETSTNPETSKDSKIQQTESSKSVDSLKTFQDSKPKIQNSGSSKSLRPKPIQKPQLKYELCHYTIHSTDDCYRFLYCMIYKREDHRTLDHESFNDHRPDDCRNFPEYEICGSYDHFTLGHNRVIHIRGRVLAESSQSSVSSIGVKCNTCGSTVYSTTDHNEFDHFKRGEKIQSLEVR